MKPSDYECNIDSNFLPSENLWRAVAPLLPEESPKPNGGRPRMPDRQAFFAIFYILRTGIQWNALPRCLGAASIVHDRFQQWQATGVFEELWINGLIEYNTDVGLDFQWQSIDGAMTKAPLGGEQTGPNPTDRGKKGTKRYLLTEAQGMPIALAVTGAQRHVKTQVVSVIESIPFRLPDKCEQAPQHFCADKGYDYKDVRSFINYLGYISHIKSRGEEKKALRIPDYRARRWVCERTHSWLNRFR